MNNTTYTPIFLTAHKQRGLSLIELLIAMVIGLVILAAGSAVYVSSARGSATSDQSTRLNEDGVLALNFLQSQIRQSGFYQKLAPGNLAAPAAANLANNDQDFHLSPLRGCRGALGNQANYRGISCAAAANGNDAIVVQYEADANNTYPTTANPNLPTNCNGETITGQYNTTLVQGNQEPRYQAVNRFFIGTGNDANTLMCQGNTTSNTVAPAQPLFPNVEQMVIRYGVAAQTMVRQEDEFNAGRHQVVFYATATEVDGLGGTQAENWGRVRSVNICLLVRSQDEVNDGSNVANFTDCNNTAQVAGDNFLRRTFVSTVMLRNRMVIPDAP